MCHVTCLLDRKNTLPEITLDMETHTRHDRNVTHTIARKMDREIKRVAKCVTVNDTEEVNRQVNEALSLIGQDKPKFRGKACME